MLPCRDGDVIITLFAVERLLIRRKMLMRAAAARALFSP